MNRLSALLALLAAVTVVPVRASAQSGAAHAEAGATHPGSPAHEFDANPVHVAVFAGDAFAFGGASRGPYGAGFGLRAGYAASFGLYVGFAFTSHFGSSKDLGCSIARPAAGDSPCPTTLEAATFSGQYAMELGWDIHAGPVRLQPYVGLGLLGYGVSNPGNFQFAGGVHSTSNADNRFIVAPGVLAVVPLPLWRLFVGVDLRALIVPVERSDTWNFAGYLTAGFTLGG